MEKLKWEIPVLESFETVDSLECHCQAGSAATGSYDICNTNGGSAAWWCNASGGSAGGCQNTGGTP